MKSSYGCLRHEAQPSASESFGFNEVWCHHSGSPGTPPLLKWGHSAVEPSSGVKLKKGRSAWDSAHSDGGRNYPGALSFHGHTSDSPMSISVKPSALMASMVLLSIVSRQRLASWGSSNKRAWKDKEIHLKHKADKLLILKSKHFTSSIDIIEISWFV